jgi:hypothetical protein
VESRSAVRLGRTFDQRAAGGDGFSEKDEGKDNEAAALLYDLGQVISLACTLVIARLGVLGVENAHLQHGESV